MPTLQRTVFFNTLRWNRWFFKGRKYGNCERYHGRVRPGAIVLAGFLAPTLFAQSYAAPAGIRPVLKRVGPSILPGGRIVAPAGPQYPAGDATHGFAVSPSGATLIVSSSRPKGFSLTIAEPNRAGTWQSRQFDFDGADLHSTILFNGLAFDGDKSVYLPQGTSGNISQFEWKSDRSRDISLKDRKSTRLNSSHL